MDAVPKLSEGMVRLQATAESFERGQDYHQGGAVGALVQRGDTIQADVEGSQFEPYRVQITFDQAGITDADCSCPYDWGGWCKHLVAAALAILDDPDQVEVGMSLDDLVADMDRETLQELVVDLVARHPGLADEIEAWVDSRRSAVQDDPAAPASTPVPRRTPVDPQPIRRRTTAILHSLIRCVGPKPTGQSAVW